MTHGCSPSFSPARTVQTPHRRASTRRRVLAAAVLALIVMAGALVPAQMDLRQAAGVPLPANDLPAGTVSVRVVRESFANNLKDVDVTFLVDGQPSRARTDEGGRAQLTGLRQGATVKVSAEVNGERLDSQQTTIASTGIRFVLVAGLGGSPGTAAPPAPAAKGSVFLGPESRIVLDYSDERLNVYYVLHVVNPAASPVDIGGPLIVELPDGARGASKLEGSAEQATVNGPRVTITGPFAPGTTTANIGFELPFGGSTARLEQQWPAEARQMTVFLLKSGDIDIQSPQISNKRTATEQGQPLVVGLIPALPAGRSLEVDITGLPHHATWPRNLALALGGLLTLAGIWVAVFPGRSAA
jgi:hypothetical protein